MKACRRFGAGCKGKGGMEKSGDVGSLSISQSMKPFGQGLRVSFAGFFADFFFFFGSVCLGMLE